MRFAIRSEASPVGCGSGLSDRLVYAGGVGELLYHGPDPARWSHLGQDGSPWYVRRLDLEPRRRARDVAVDLFVCWQGHAHVQAPIGAV